MRSPPGRGIANPRFNPASELSRARERQSRQKNGKVEFSRIGGTGHSHEETMSCMGIEPMATRLKA